MGTTSQRNQRIDGIVQSEKLISKCWRTSWCLCSQREVCGCCGDCCQRPWMGTWPNSKSRTAGLPESRFIVTAPGIHWIVHLIAAYSQIMASLYSVDSTQKQSRKRDPGENRSNRRILQSLKFAKWFVFSTLHANRSTIMLQLFLWYVIWKLVFCCCPCCWCCLFLSFIYIYISF